MSTAEYQAEKRIDNLERYRKYNRDYYYRWMLSDPRALLFKKAKNVPCTDCKESFPWQIMEFDHVLGNKEFGITTHSIRRRSLEELEMELAKCEVRCPTCHKLRHYNERSSDGK